MSPTATGTDARSRLHVVPDVPRQGQRTSPPARSGPPRPPRRGSTYSLGSPGRRLRGAAILLLVMFLILSSRLIWLQGFQSKSYTALAEKQRTRAVTQAAHRGEITDRNGVVLAVDVDARDIYAQPPKIANKEDAAARLAPILGKSPAELLPKLASAEPFLYLALGTDPGVGKAVDALNITGVGVLPERKRIYPNNDLAANIVGFTGRDGHGLTGVESQFDKSLAGRDGRLVLEEDPSGRPIPSGTRREKEPEPGQGVQLTIDRDLQWKTQSALVAQVQKAQADGGVAIAMNPHTGDVLAMASAPTFNLNDPAKATADAYQNRATNWTFEPGSVNKVITMATALDRGLITPTTEVTVPPNMRIDGFTIGDAEAHGVERMTAAGVLAKSSNLGTVLISRKLGPPSEMEAALRNFGLGAPTGLGWPGESQGLLAPSSTWAASTAATVAFGQGMSVTAMQIASAYATIANGGVRVTPRLINGTVDPNGDVHPTTPGPTRRVVSAQAASTVSQMLEEVTSKQGTAPQAAIPGYRVAGKTGTADRIDDKGKYNGKVATFVGFAPADNPDVVVAVVLDNPKNGYFGGTVSAPVFADIAGFALASRRVVPSGTPAPSFPVMAP
ncbi:MAG TPA: penicillin-binding protein 2 [Frankiaceae bacterium]|nr:penicillin-binding protein 2 [Frankiaceae bacterium]